MLQVQRTYIYKHMLGLNGEKKVKTQIYKTKVNLSTVPKYLYVITSYFWSCVTNILTITFNVILSITIEFDD